MLHLLDFKENIDFGVGQIFTTPTPTPDKNNRYLSVVNDTDNIVKNVTKLRQRMGQQYLLFFSNFLLMNIFINFLMRLIS